MSKRDTRKAQQQIPRPAATECVCGTWRTPGVTHAKGDTGPDPKNTIGAEWCSK